MTVIYGILILVSHWIQIYSWVTWSILKWKFLKTVGKNWEVIVLILVNFNIWNVRFFVGTKLQEGKSVKVDYINLCHRCFCPWSFVDRLCWRDKDKLCLVEIPCCIYTNMHIGVGHIKMSQQRQMFPLWNCPTTLSAGDCGPWIYKLESVKTRTWTTAPMFSLGCVSSTNKKILTFYKTIRIRWKLEQCQFNELNWDAFIWFCMIMDL